MTREKGKSRKHNLNERINVSVVQVSTRYLKP